VISLLLRTEGPILTMREPHHAPKRGHALGDLDILFGGYVGVDVRGGKIIYLSQREPDETLVNGKCITCDLGNRVVMPGFIDCHNHLLWAGSRAHEFYARCSGASYREIAEAGGGINYTRDKTLAASEDELVEIGRRHLRMLANHGVTTVEAKSGYALTREGELTMLRAAARLRSEFAGTIVSTYLGGHSIPPEYKTCRDEYINEVIATLSQVKAEGLAEFCDVFIDPIALTNDEGFAIAKAARSVGLNVKMHADEFGDNGTAALGIEVGAVSVDHLAGISEETIRKLGESSTVAVLLPTTMFYTSTDMSAPARALIDAGAIIALATDLNPGSSLIFDPSFVLTLAGLHMHLGCDEALNAHVRNAAFAIGRGYTKGSLMPGMDADILVLDTNDYRELGYYIGADNIEMVIARGRFLKRDGKLCDTLAGDDIYSLTANIGGCIC
jgi:imidazolonepropionase